MQKAKGLEKGPMPLSPRTRALPHTRHRPLPRQGSRRTHAHMPICPHAHADADADAHAHPPPLIPPAPAAALFCVWACQSALSLPSIPAHRLPRISPASFAAQRWRAPPLFWEKHPLLPLFAADFARCFSVFHKVGASARPTFFKVLILFFIFGKISYFLSHRPVIFFDFIAFSSVY